MRRAIASLALCLVVPASLAGAGAAQADERLSDERSVTRWSTPVATAPVRSQPDKGARRVARLRYTTEDGMPEVYVALVRREVGGREWLKVRVPRRPNGTVGWVPRSAMGPLHVVRTRLVISRRSFKLALYRRGKVIFRTRVGVGAPGTPTPGGRFWIRERLRGSGGSYGPWAFGTSAYSVLSDWPGGGVIGIHGTNEPNRIPGRPSHGCIRLRNGEIVKLAKLLPVGTPVRIH